MYGKILIQCKLKVLTGMHIGGNDTFSAIGAVDKPVIRDPHTNNPILPGSSLKGKLRTLLARSECQKTEQLPKCDADNEVIRRLFGSTGEGFRHARLQFSDSFICNADEFNGIGLTEVKAENSIDRKTAISNPRQIERVNSGVRFSVSIVYDAVEDSQIEQDFSTLAKGMKLLQFDYLGGHGTRGYGRVCFEDIHLEALECNISKERLANLENGLKEGVSQVELFRK